MIDTHTHLYFTETYPDGGDAAVVRALEAGVSHMVLPSVSLGSTDTLLGLHSRWPDVTSVAVGLHPTELKADWRDELREIRYRFGDTPTVAWGEIGLDFHYGREEATRQMDAFGYQLDEAYSEGKPVIIHSRDALEETLHVTGLMGVRTPRLLFHSFTSGAGEVRRILEAHPEALFGFNGVATFKNASGVRDAVREAGIERIVLETDSPYLAPVPRRGTTNESCNIPYILACVAAECSLDVAQAERITDSNARSLFRL